jgi:predicted nucleic acid-binding protein
MAPVRRFARLLRESPTVRRVRISEASVDASLALLPPHGDERWSLTDGTSFGTMREAGVKRAFTFDPNFAEAGFEVLPGA